jgi:hypothetical protein
MEPIGFWGPGRVISIFGEMIPEYFVRTWIVCCSAPVGIKADFSLMLILLKPALVSEIKPSFE